MKIYKVELNKENVKIKEYDEIYEYIKNIKQNEVVLIDTCKSKLCNI